MKTLKSLTRQWVIILLLGITLTDGFSQNDRIFDSFERIDVNTRKYPNFIGCEEGFDIYADNNARVDLFVVKGGNNNDIPESALRIAYVLPPADYSEKWISIRRVFNSAMCLEKYQGISFKIKVITQSPCKNFLLRFTLIDKDKRHPSMGDELWWFTIPAEAINDAWVTAKIPFDKFQLNYGIGSRINNARLDLNEISGYEINLITSSGSKKSIGFLFLSELHVFR